MKLKILLVIVLFLALTLRLYGINWDGGQHLHPDERFLTMVAVASKLPSSLGHYLNPATSPLNPSNVGFTFFVYGTLPLTIAKMLAVFFGFDTYERFTILGRLLSAIMDVGTIVFIFKIVQTLENKYTINEKLKYIAAFLYSVFVLPIQLSHFFAVDTFLTFFLTGALFFSLRYYYKQSFQDSALAGLFAGLATASKISAIYSLPLFIIFFALPLLHIDKKNSTARPKKMVWAFGLFCLVFYSALRLGSPYIFESGSIFNLHLNPQFVANIKQLESFNEPTSFFPPGIQWITKKPVLFALQNIVFFGVGIPISTFILWGMVLLYKKRCREIVAIGLWTGLFFLYQSTQFVKSIRYFYILYPLLAIVGAYGFLDIWQRFSKPIYKGAILVFVVLWPLAFMHIYAYPHSRVVASRWIYENIPTHAVLAQEHWDDSLPLLLSDEPIFTYEIKQLPVFDPDTSQKWEVINTELAKADYIIFTSNRGYGSIMPLPQKYPRMSQFYTDLFSGRLPFKKIKEFTSYPQLCFMFHVSCFMFNDQWSDEAFTVYDHPKVTIFQRM